MTKAQANKPTPKEKKTEKESIFDILARRSAPKKKKTERESILEIIAKNPSYPNRKDVKKGFWTGKWQVHHDTGRSRGNKACGIYDSLEEANRAAKASWDSYPEHTDVEDKAVFCDEPGKPYSEYRTFGVRSACVTVGVHEANPLLFAAADLKKEAKKLGLLSTGTKLALLRRLNDHWLANQKTPSEEAPSEQAPKDDQ